MVASNLASGICLSAAPGLAGKPGGKLSPVSGYTAWYDAQAETYSDDDTVTTITDQANAHNLTDGTGPTYKTGVLGGKNAYRFNGTTHELDGAAGTTLSDVVTAGAGEIFAVINIANFGASAGNVWELDQIFGEGSGYWGLYERDNSGGQIFIYTWDGGAKTAATSITSGADHVVHAYHDGTNIGISVDGGAYTTTACGNVSVLTGLLSSGERAATNQHYDGDVAEILVYNSTLSSADRTSTIDYLKQRYGIS